MAKVAGAKGQARTPWGVGGVSFGGGGVDMHITALWSLMAIELGVLVALRRYFRRHHGG